MDYVESSLKKWYDDMESSPGLYDGYRELGEDSAIGPQERLQEMFLKRLNGFSVELAVTYTEAFGNVRLHSGPEGLVFDLPTLQKNGMTSVCSFTSDKGVSGTARLDWKHQTFVFVPENGEPATYVVNEFMEYAMIWGVGHQLTIGILCAIAPILESDTDRTHEFLSDVSLNKFHIENLIFADRSKLGKDGRFNPQAGVTLKDVAEVTGVSASTLSNIRNGKKSLENLTWTTLAALSFYAKIRLLDMHIIDMLRQQFTGDSPVLAGDASLKDSMSGVDCVVVTLRDGTGYRVQGDGNQSADAVYDDLFALYEDERTAMDLTGVTSDFGEPGRRMMVPKVDVKHIRVDRLPTK